MSDEDGYEYGHITIRRIVEELGIMDYVEAIAADGTDLPLAEALGMMRLAEDTLIRTRMGETD